MRQPCLASARTTCDPMKPEPPKTVTRPRMPFPLLPEPLRLNRPAIARPGRRRNAARGVGPAAIETRRLRSQLALRCAPARGPGNTGMADTEVLIAGAGP